MKFAWDPELETGGAQLIAIPEDYDAQPVPAVLRMDLSPRFSSANRLAVAATLAFAPFLSGGITFPQSVPPELAIAVSNFLAPTTVHPGPLEFHPKQIAQEGQTFRLSFDGAEAGVQQQDIPTLHLANGAHIFGPQTSPGYVTVPTNAPFLARGEGPIAQFLPALAVGLLLAEDLNIGVFQVARSLKSQYPRWKKMSELLRLCGLAVVTEPVAQP